MSPGTFVSIRVLFQRKGQPKWQPGFQVIGSCGPTLPIRNVDTSKIYRLNQRDVRVIPEILPYEEIDPLSPKKDRKENDLPETASPLILPDEPNIGNQIALASIALLCTHLNFVHQTLSGVNRSLTMFPCPFKVPLNPNPESLPKALDIPNSAMLSPFPNVALLVYSLVRLVRTISRFDDWIGLPNPMIYPDDDRNPQQTTHDDQPERRLHNTCGFELISIYSQRTAMASSSANHPSADAAIASSSMAAFSSSAGV
ncbi:hypothetical protein CAPTEDRAFT_208472 [Capitella teleta]|uniref:Uncharacterized protein n=1 Tax=Capitella teleta TaxID=283909 RepID=R7VAJ3_CAPTE|nr:hypothetical protein CAPTEDRAFT_208472 [Capitella teleta]|eukprot:ELU12700.1 hypothetical protein CAPTEDRAFT_208472 [Capitella teleta]